MAKEICFSKLLVPKLFLGVESWKSIIKWYFHLWDSKIVPLNAPCPVTPSYFQSHFRLREHAAEKTPKQTPKQTHPVFSINKNVPHLQHSTPIPSCFPRITSSTIGWCFHQLFQYHPPPKRSRPSTQQRQAHAAVANGTILPLQPPEMPRVRPAETEPKVHVVEAARAVHHGKEPKVPETSKSDEFWMESLTNYTYVINHHSDPDGTLQISAKKNRWKNCQIDCKLLWGFIWDELHNIRLVSGRFGTWVTISKWGAMECRKTCFLPKTHSP